jgi:hypothetical protein
MYAKFKYVQSRKLGEKERKKNTKHNCKLGDSKILVHKLNYIILKIIFKYFV